MVGTSGVIQEPPNGGFAKTAGFPRIDGNHEQTSAVLIKQPISLHLELELTVVICLDFYVIHT